MTDLDDQLHEGFRAVRVRVERLSLPDVSNREPRGSKRPRAVAALSAALVVLVIAGVAVIAGHSQTPSRVPTTTPSTGAATVAPLAGFLSVPLHGDGHTVTVWNWDGQRDAVVHPSAVADCCTTVSLSPDGTRLQVLRTPQGADIIDLHTGGVQHAADAGVWADDSRHRCALRPTQAGDCCVVDPDGAAHRIGTVGSNTTHGGPGVLLCSVTAHRALISNSFLGQVDGLEAVSLVNPPVITPILPGQAFPAEGIAVSGNGRYLATRTLTGAAQTVVYDLQHQTPLRRVTGAPIALSWNGRYLVTQTDTQAEVVEWRTGRIVWHSRPNPNSPAQLAVGARPERDDLAINVSNQPGQPYRASALWMIPTSGPPRLIANNVLFGII
jgi:hypothetical protein